MCTAISLPTDTGHFFARTLDLDYRHEESVTLTPRRYPFSFSNGRTCTDHPALLGVAYVVDGYPLYYDAVNEYGLCMAGLAFRGYGAYAAPKISAEHTVSPWELIPFVLSACRSTAEVRTLFDGTYLTDAPFSETLANQPMHWMIADTNRALVLETDGDGRVHLYDNPKRTLTNAPPFPRMCEHSAQFSHLTPNPPNHAAVGILEGVCTHGTGALGLPGDWTSPSRFVRASYLAEHGQVSDAADAFSLLDAVKVPRGAVLTDQGTPFATIYSVVLQSAPMRCYIKTDAVRGAHCMEPTALQLRGNTCVTHPL